MIDSPLVKESLEAWTFGDLSHWPTPQEYLHMIGTVTPKITQLWVDYFDNLGFDIILAPTTAITARPIDAAEPYSEINGRLEVGSHLKPPLRSMLLLHFLSSGNMENGQMQEAKGKNLREDQSSGIALRS